MRRILSVRHARFSRQEGGLIATADLLASSSNSALGFEDSELGNQVLDSMRVHPGIRSAVLYKETGQIFAWYVRTDLTGGYLPPRHPAEGVNWATSFLSFSERVFLEGKPVGKIYLEEDLNDVNSRRIHFAWVTAMMALGCMTLVYLLSWRLRRIIAQPIRNWPILRGTWLPRTQRALYGKNSVGSGCLEDSTSQMLTLVIHQRVPSQKSSRLSTERPSTGPVEDDACSEVLNR